MKFSIFFVLKQYFDRFFPSTLAFFSRRQSFMPDYRITSCNFYYDKNFSINITTDVYNLRLILMIDRENCVILT